MYKVPFTFLFLFSIHLSLLGQLNRLIQTDTGDHTHFGKKLSVYQSNLLIAAPDFNSPGASRTGRVYWFELNGKIWSNRSVIPVTSLKAYDLFGYDLSLYENTLAVSAPGAGEGKVFLYELRDHAWKLTQEITIPLEQRKLGLNFKFGDNIHLHGDWLAVSSPGYPASDSAFIPTGAVFVFKKENQNWVFKQKINPPDMTRITLFGYDLVMTDSSLVISAPAGDGGAPESGVVYLYNLVNGEWKPDFTLIDPESRSFELFGSSIDMYQEKIAIGIPGRTHDLAAGPEGAVLIYQKSSQVWQKEALLKASDHGQNDLFGHTVSIQGGYICISAPRFDYQGFKDLGKTYLFQLKEGVWKETSSFIPPQNDLQNHIQFGASLATYQSQLIIGGHLLNDGYEDNGVAYTTDLGLSVPLKLSPDPDLGVTVYPNPTMGQVRIDLGSNWGTDLQIVLYNLAGSPVIRQQFKNSEKLINWQFVSSSCPPGIYFMNISDHRNTVFYKLIKL